MARDTALLNPSCQNQMAEFKEQTGLVSEECLENLRHCYLFAGDFRECFCIRIKCVIAEFIVSQSCFGE